MLLNNIDKLVTSSIREDP